MQEQEEEEAPATGTTVTSAGPLRGVGGKRGDFGGGEEGPSLRDVALVGEWVPHSEAVVSLEVRGRLPRCPEIQESFAGYRYPCHRTECSVISMKKLQR